jgi:glucosamine--fructose-6-phosphate aminotransferase (isomerizing)
LVIAVSQSGETIDVVQPANRAKEKGAKIVALTNVLGSTLFRLSDYQVMLNAGPERAVCATKSFSAMIANIIYLTYQMVGEHTKAKQMIFETAKGVEKILEESYVEKIKKLAKGLKNKRDIYTIGRGLSYPTALEASLKLKEVPYVHSEGFAGGELKHGVIALVEKGTPCIVFAPDDETYNDVISNAIEIKSRGGYIIGISPKNNEAFDFYLPVSDVGVGSVIVNTVPIQLLAYYLALENGLDPDMPRNLAKSVTVK